MTYTIILTEDKKGHFHATVPSLPDCHAEAKTRSEALNTIREAIITLMRRSEIVQLDVSAELRSGRVHQDTPWELLGAFKADSLWGELFDKIESEREVNEN